MDGPLEEVLLRPYDALTDEGFVFDSWLKSYKFMSQFAKNIPSEIYYPWHRRIVTNIVSRPSVTITIAHPKGEAEVILGYLVTERLNHHVVHYCFVKEGFRKMGIAKKMMTEAGVAPGFTFTHWTYAMNQIVYTVQGLKYNPYLI